MSASSADGWLRRVLDEARAVAGRLGHNAFGIDHVLVALFACEEVRLAALLPAGVDGRAARRAVEELLGPPVPVRAARVRGPSPLLRRALEDVYRTLEREGRALDPAAFLEVLLRRSGLPAIRALAALGLPRADASRPRPPGGSSPGADPTL